MNEFTACTAWLSARPGSPEIFGKGLLPVCGKSPGGDDSAARRQIALPARVFAQQLSASAMIPSWLIKRGSTSTSTRSRVVRAIARQRDIGMCAWRKRRARSIVRCFSSFRLLPWEHRDLGVGRQRGDIDRGLQRMPCHVIRQYQHRRPAVPDKVARCGQKADRIRGAGPYPTLPCRSVRLALRRRSHRRVSRAACSCRRA
jgi:hypothetical protein